MSELLNYNTSWLNPALKILIAVLFILVSIVYFRSRRFYAGDIRVILSILFWMAVIGAIAAILRYLGHGTDFGFTKEFSLKWFQSFGYILQASLFALAGWMLSKEVIPELKE